MQICWWAIIVFPAFGDQTTSWFELIIFRFHVHTQEGFESRPSWIPSLGAAACGARGWPIGPRDCGGGSVGSTISTSSTAGGSTISTSSTAGCSAASVLNKIISFKIVSIHSSIELAICTFMQIGNLHKSCCKSCLRDFLLMRLRHLRHAGWTLVFNYLSRHFAPFKFKFQVNVWIGHHQLNNCRTWNLVQIRSTWNPPSLYIYILWSLEPTKLY